MAGLYIHIPFCKQACHYCNFHFSTNLSTLDDLVSCLCLEIASQTSFLPTNEIETIYFGGGTPSLLTIDHFESIFNTIRKHFTIAPEAEITLEANPDDVTVEVIRTWQESGVNRISLGIQSLHEDDLTFMNRSHSASQSAQSLELLLRANCFEISADLIFGFQGLTEQKLLHNIHYLAGKPIQHLSCYALTIESKTAFHHQVSKGLLQHMEDNLVNDQFHLIEDSLNAYGFDHYEVSNYCRSGQYAKHNSNYWKRQSYLGIGPSAHSYDGDRRVWNVANNVKYCKAIKSGMPVAEEECLTSTDKYNEYLLTSLRTKWGARLSDIKSFGPEVKLQFDQDTLPYFDSGQLILEDETVKIPTEHWTIADRITSDLFLV